MIGFFNCWQITGDQFFLNQFLAAWQFIKDHIKDKKNGEWFWGIKENYTLMDEDKTGIWKGPYHNSRACIELIKRISKVLSLQS